MKKVYMKQTKDLILTWILEVNNIRYCFLSNPKNSF